MTTVPLTDLVDRLDSAVLYLLGFAAGLGVGVLIGWMFA